MNCDLAPMHKGPKDYDKEKEDQEEEHEDQDQEEEESDREEPDREELESEHTDERPTVKPDENYRQRWQRECDNHSGQGRRIFSIPKPPVLQRSPIMKGSRVRSTCLHHQAQL